MPPPFRWDITRREQLGRIAEAPLELPYPQLVDDLSDCCARVAGLAAGCDLMFVGRSPESLFDLLGGLVQGTSWAERMHLVNLSLRDGAGELAPDRVHAARDLLGELGLAPADIAARPRDIAFVDLVATGGTFGKLAALLCDWAREAGLGDDAVRRRLRFVGITWQRHTSPNTERWQQHAAWTRQFRPSAIKNASLAGRLWDYLGNRQAKVTPSNPPSRWTDPAMLAPPQRAEHRAALRLALHLFDAGRTDEVRARFVSRLVEQPAMRTAALRSLVAELRGHTARR